MFGRLDLGFELLRKVILMGSMVGEPTHDVTIISGGDVHPGDVKVTLVIFELVHFSFNRSGCELRKLMYWGSFVVATRPAAVN